MAITQNLYEGDNSTTNYSFTFEYLKQTDIKVQLDADVTTAWSLANATTVAFDSAPGTGVKIKIYRETDTDTSPATFYAGSAIKSEDLNDNFTQNLYSNQEVNARYLSNLGGTMTGSLTMGEDAKVIFEGGTDDDYETTLYVADPTADRTITLPNVTGTVVTTGDTGTVTSTMIADGTVTSTDIADGTIATGDIANDAITNAKIATDAVNADSIAANSVGTSELGADAVTGAQLADNAVDSEHYTDGSIDTVHIADLNVTTAKIAADAITGAKIADDAIDSEHYTDGSIDTAHIADAQITTAKLVDANVTTAKIAADAITGAKVADDAIDSEHLAADSIDAEHYAAGSVDTTALGADAVTSAKIGDDQIDSEHYVDGSIDTAHIADANVTLAKVENVTDGNIIVGNGSNRPASVAVSGDVTIANTGAVTIANDAVEIGMIGCEQTTITDSDSHIPTSGAVVDYVASVVAPIGGLEVIADEDNFPTSQPVSGVVISIADAAGVVVNGSGVSSTARTVGNGSDNVTINGFPSSLYSETLVTGNGLMVTSTGSGHIYNYHKLLASESDVKQLSDDINDFNSRYRINAGEPSSNNDDGDLVWDTNADKMKVYDGTSSSWKEVTSSGDFKFLVAVDAGTTTAATFDGSDTSFDLKEATNSGSAASVTNINQLMIVLNGVVQKPNAGSWSGSGEGFYLTDSDTIRFATAPPTGSTCFIVQSGSAVSIPTPGDGTVTAAKIANGAVVEAGIGTGAVTAAKIGTGAVEHAKLAADAVDGDNIQDDVINSEHIAAGAVDLEHMSSQSVDEDNLYIDNAGSNGQFLSKQSGGTGGLLWADGASEGTSVKSTGESGGTKFLREDGDGTCSWQTISIPKLATPTITGDLVVADAGTVTHTITNYDAELTYTFSSVTNCSLGAINTSNGQFVITETGDHPSYTVKAETDALGLDDSATVTKNIKTRLSAPTLSSPADTQTATNVVYTITSTNANDDKLILDPGTANFTYHAVSVGSASKVGNTVEVTGFSTNNPAVTIQYTAEATYSVTAKAVDTGGTWGDSASSSADSIVIQNTTGPFDYLVIAGGASGGTRGGGGGAGGMRASWNSETSGGGGSSESQIATLNIGTVYTIDVGTGGAAIAAPTWTQGTDGADSSITGTGLTAITSEGGGGGGDSSPAAGRDGGSGGGGGLSGSSGPGGAGTANQGYPGGNNNPGGSSPSGGGGGAGGAGTNGTPASPSPQSGPGGPGLASTISGSSVTYAGGGGGSAHTGYNAHGNGPGSPGSGGSGGGGGGSAENAHGTAGTDGLGAGGGGAYGGSNPWYSSGKGGDGTVYLRMATSVYSGTQTNGTVTTSGSDTIIRWTQDGTYTA